MRRKGTGTRGGQGYRQRRRRRGTGKVRRRGIDSLGGGKGQKT